MTEDPLTLAAEYGLVLDFDKEIVYKKAGLDHPLIWFPMHPRCTSYLPIFTEAVEEVVSEIKSRQEGEKCQT